MTTQPDWLSRFGLESLDEASERTCTPLSELLDLDENHLFMRLAQLLPVVSDTPEMQAEHFIRDVSVMTFPPKVRRPRGVKLRAVGLVRQRGRRPRGREAHRSRSSKAGRGSPDDDGGSESPAGRCRVCRGRLTRLPDGSFVCFNAQCGGDRL